MPWTPLEGLCEVCGRPDEKGNPFCDEEFYPGVYFHLRCLNSPVAVEWRAARRAENPIFDRYLRQITQREPIDCPSCGKTMARIPKGGGMGASDWPAHCSNCHRMGARKVSVYCERQVWQAISDLHQDFAKSRGLETIQPRLHEVAARYDHLVNLKPCVCGGRFSLAATARCLGCDGVVSESWFHRFEEPMSEERNRWMKELFDVDFDV